MPKALLIVNFQARLNEEELLRVIYYVCRVGSYCSGLFVCFVARWAWNKVWLEDAIKYYGLSHNMY